jgi:hypothetical protein
MNLLPLVPSAHPSSWANDAGLCAARETGTLSATSSCQFCGWSAPGWQEVFHLNGDHDDNSTGNLAVACVLCHLPQHLDRPRINQEATLIWLPDIPQAAVIALARRIHQILVVQGEPPHMERRPRGNSPALIAAYKAYKALLSGQATVREYLGTTSPVDLGAALLTLRDDLYAQRADLLGGIRLLPLGRLFHEGEDIYPSLLAAAGKQVSGRERRPC